MISSYLLGGDLIEDQGIELARGGRQLDLVDGDLLNEDRRLFDLWRKLEILVLRVINHVAMIDSG